MEQLSELFKFDVSSHGLSDGHVDLLRPDLNISWGNNIGGLILAIYVSVESCFKALVRMHDDKDDIFGDFVHDRFLGNTRKMLALGRAIHAMVIEVLRIKSLPLSMITIALSRQNKEEFFRGLKL